MLSFSHVQDMETCINPSTFSAAAISLHIDDKLKQKIQQLLETYDCFKETVSFQYKPKMAPIIRKHRHVVETRYKSKIHGNDDMGHIRSLLNKLSEQNYCIVKEKLVKCMGLETSKEVISLVVYFMYMHRGYSYLYLSLLQEVANTDSEHVIPVLKSFISDHVTSFKTELESLQNEPDTKDYDEYCKYIKKRNMLESQHTVAVMLDIHFFQNQYMSVFVTLLEDIAMNATYTSEWQIITSMVLQHIQHYDLNLMKSLVHHYQNIAKSYAKTTVISSMKLVFCWQEIIKKCESVST
jgi:hypothetical protein